MDNYLNDARVVLSVESKYSALQTKHSLSGDAYALVLLTVWVMLSGAICYAYIDSLVGYYITGTTPLWVLNVVTGLGLGYLIVGYLYYRKGLVGVEELNSD